MTATLRSLLLFALAGIVACGPPTRRDDDDVARFCESASECFDGETCVGRRCVPGCVDDGDCTSGVCDRQAGVCVEEDLDGGQADAGEDIDAGEPLDGGEAHDGGEAPDAGEEPEGDPCVTHDDCEPSLACHPDLGRCRPCDAVNACAAGAVCVAGACVEKAEGCSLNVVPAAESLDFGPSPVGFSSVKSVTFTNVGDAPCELTHARITGGLGFPGLPSDTDYFTVQKQPASPLAPGASTAVEVSFLPDSELTIGEYGGAWLEVDTTDTSTFDGSDCKDALPSPSPGCARWSLTGSGVTTELIALPGSLHFGEVATGCQSRTWTVTLRTLTEVTITGLKIESGAADAYILGSPPPPFTISPDQPANVAVRYRPSAQGAQPSNLLIKSNAVNRSPNSEYLVVPLTGVGTASSAQIDTFSGSKSDVLFVIDDSGSMADEQAALAANAGRFLGLARDHGVDFQVGVVTTDTDSRPGELRGATKIVRNGPNAESDFAAIVSGLGTYGSGMEKGLDAIVKALSPPKINDPALNAGFLRHDATLTLVVISDEDDYSAGSSEQYATILETLKGAEHKDRVSFVAMVGDAGGCTTADEGTRYLDVRSRLGGAFISICSGDWGDVADELGRLAFGRQAPYRLSRPAVAETIQVKVEGQISTRPDWSYDTASNAVVFDEAHRPAADAAVTVAYEAACF